MVQFVSYGAIQGWLLDSHSVVEILWDGERLRVATHLAAWEHHTGRDPLSRVSFRYERLRDVTQVQGAGVGPRRQL